MTDAVRSAPPPLFTDSRRLFGPSLWLDAPGAILDASVPHGHDPALLREWRGRVERMAGGLGWGRTETGERRHAGGTMLGLTAPPDLLMTATSLNEWALHAGAREAGVEFDPASLDEASLPVEEAEARARLEALAAEEARSPARGGAVVPPSGLPVVLVTGSNGKTTTTRILAAILRAHGHTVGFTCTDGVYIGGERMEQGDWSGPLGAARVLGDASVTAAILETARGGLLRRGLVVARADAAIITNVAVDHFGEYGVDSLQDLAEVKGLVSRALGLDGTLVLNGDDPLLSPEGSEATTPPPSVRPGPFRVRRFSLERPWPRELPPIEALPIAAGGDALYNAANALAASVAAESLGVPVKVIADTLERFGEDPEDNPGRLMKVELGGVTVFVDYAHNPDGLSALLAAIRPQAEGRLLVLLGQAGDRDDEAIRALARAAWQARPDLVILREMSGYLRGRAPLEVPRILEGELLRLGARPDRLQMAADEMDAVREALDWAREGDLLVFPLHALTTRERVQALLSSLRAGGWRVGDELP